MVCLLRTDGLRLDTLMDSSIYIDLYNIYQYKRPFIYIGNAICKIQLNASAVHPAL